MEGMSIWRVCRFGGYVDLVNSDGREDGSMKTHHEIEEDKRTSQ